MGKGLKFAVIGDPVDHSLSPRIHTAALADTGLDGVYTKRRAKASDLPAIIAELRGGALSGINVTMPLKSEAWAATEEATPEARRARSVNTLRCREGVIEGHSTDAVAFGEVLGRAEWRGAPLLILGAGGAARAALAAAERRPAYVATRRGVLPDDLGSTAELVPWGASVAGALVINATPLGMAGESLPPDILEAASGLIDLPYGDTPTAGVTEARSAGIDVVDGIEFLARQAAASFTWWTGRTVELEVLERAARNI